MTPPCSPEEINRLARLLEHPAGRYGLYPPLSAFSATFTADDFAAAVARSNGDLIPRALALHVEVPPPFRAERAPGPVPPPARDMARGQVYVQRLVRDISRTGALFDRDRDVAELTLAPGVPRLLASAQLDELIDSLTMHFRFPPIHALDMALALDVDACHRHELVAWQSLGFRRVSVGSPSRLAPTNLARGADIARAVQECQSAGFGNVRIELAYACEGCEPDGLGALLGQVLAARPDRIGLRSAGDETRPSVAMDAPTPEGVRRAHCLLHAAAQLEDAGYLHVGMDVFALPGDPLVLAQRRSQLYRTVLGYGSHGELDVVGFGVGAVSQIGGSHSRAHPALESWEQAVESGAHPTACGISLDDDDCIRADIIQQVLCQGRITTQGFADRYGIEFDDMFAPELALLAPWLDQGLLARGDGVITLGRLLRLAPRGLAAVFDRFAGANVGASMRAHD